MVKRVLLELSEVSLLLMPIEWSPGRSSSYCSVLESEIVTAMQLMGVTKLDELKPEMVDCLRAL